ANQGDYQGIASEGNSVYLCWSDPRLGDPDAFFDGPTFSSVLSCPAPSAGTSAADPMLSFALTNDGNVESELEWTVEDDNGWLVSAVPSISGSALLTAGNSQLVEATFQLPSDCSPTEVDTILFISSDPEIPGRRDTCLTTLTCSPTVDVPGLTAALSLAPARPNPSSGAVDLSFILSRQGPARLTIYNAAGARVRTLVNGVTPAGPHRLVWDGRDDRGRQAPSEVYYVRLEAEGTSLNRSVVLVR
ncbi:MAG: FlgD immunoglobulin-like domain containing protein, partial [Planctomycetota bacterium]